MEPQVNCVIDAVVRVLAVIIWPLFIFIVIMIFEKHIRDILDMLARIKKFGRDEFSTYPPTSDDLSTKEVVSPIFKPNEIQSSINKALEHPVLEFRAATERAFFASMKSDYQSAVRDLKKANEILPGQWAVLHNLAVELIRMGKAFKRAECFVEAEQVCRHALITADEFPYGTYYNLARAQAAGGNISGLRETFAYMQKIRLPDNLGFAIVKGDKDFEEYDEVKTMPELIALKESLRPRFTSASNQ